MMRSMRLVGVKKAGRKEGARSGVKQPSEKEEKRHAACSRRTHLALAETSSIFIVRGQWVANILTAQEQVKKRLT
jgi:hypothetical protein